MADVLLGVFDADDNLWVNVNAVWVFKKGSGSKAQERIPTEEFAEVRGDIGKRGKYKDYEYWDDPKKGSFREFLDPEDGTNPLLENLKKAVRERPLADIFGDSWDAFAYLLSVNPKGVHILTASGVSREQFLEALAWLKAQGLIPDAPPIENIQCVGNPKHPFYAGSASPSLAKLKVVKPILDRQQALAKQLGRRAPRLLTPAGDGFAHLLPFGFSDDDKGNFTTMRDGVPGEKGLAEEFKAGRWPDLKLTLFYTDRDDPESGAFVIAPDGKPRDVSADEYGETFMKGNSQEADVRPKKGPKKNPRPATRRVNVADVDALIDKVYFSVDAPGVEDEKVETNVDLIALDADALREFLERKVPAGWKKAFYAERYTADDPHIQAVLESAERYGDVDGTLVLPLDTAMDVDFKDGETSTTDLRRARPKDTDGGRLVAGIMGHGWKVNDRKARLKLVTPPLYNHGDEDRDPLMHKKRLITVLTGPNGEKIYHCKSGTGNWSTRNQRVNMVVETHHPAIVEHELAELQASVDAFMDWKPIKAIQAVQPRRILTNNGETLLLASTAGQYNTNHLFLDAIAKTVDDPANYKLLDADLYHFVMTLSAGMKLIKDALEKHPEAWLNLVADMKFAPQRGWGEAANTGGFLVLKPFQPSFPWPGRIRNRVKGYIYQRAIEGAVQRDLEGPPTATFVYHLKLSLARILERGEEWQYISLGSLNFSNNYHNAEFQWLWRLKPTSRWHRVMRGLALGHAEAHPEWAVPVWRAPLRDTAARLIGHAQTQVPVAEMRPLEQAAKEKRLSELGLRLMRLLAEGTTLVRDTFPPDTARRNILRFLDIVGLYGDFEKLLAGVLSPLSIPRTANAALPLAYKEHSAYDIRTALRSLLWEPSIDRAKLERMVDAIWKAVGLDEHLAEMQRLREKEKEEKEKAAAKRAAGEAASAAGEE
ncbi:MAG: hypothetical protein HY554_17510 [Elusimicrobia bacterium]|nr:hypothetical protein [Elusimicrobiota bacterium]